MDLQIFKKIVIVLVVTVGLVALLEYGASQVVELPQAVMLPDARLNHTWPKSKTRVHKEWSTQAAQFAKPYVHFYNSAGFIRRTEVTKEKPADTYRIFYVGDSFVEGTLPMEDAVPAFLERELNQLGAKKRFEVINAGVMSYSPILEYIWVRYYLADYHPDLIVLNIDMTDVFDDWKYRRTLQVDAEGNPYAVPPEDLFERAFVETDAGVIKLDSIAKIKFFLYRRSYVFNLLQNIKAMLSEKQSAATETKDSLHAQGILTRFAWCEEHWDDLTRASVDYSLDTVRRLLRFCNRQGIKVVLTGVPHYEQLVKRPDGTTQWSLRPHHELARIAEEEGVPFLDTLTPLSAAVSTRPREDYFYRGDMHFNPRGYQLWGEVHLRGLKAVLAEAGIL